MSFTFIHKAFIRLCIWVIGALIFGAHSFYAECPILFGVISNFWWRNLFYVPIKNTTDLQIYKLLYIGARHKYRRKTTIRPTKHYKWQSVQHNNKKKTMKSPVENGALKWIFQIQKFPIEICHTTFIQPNE